MPLVQGEPQPEFPRPRAPREMTRAWQLSLAGLLMIAVLPFPAPAQDNPLAFTGAKIIPVVGDPIENGVLVLQAGKILAVGSAGSVTVPAVCAFTEKVNGTTGSAIGPALAAWKTFWDFCTR